jgi:alanine racemase
VQVRNEFSMNTVSQDIAQNSVTPDKSVASQRPEPATSAVLTPAAAPPRPAWIEIDLERFRRNYQIINEHKPRTLQVLAVVKDEAYGHGALPLARAALEHGAAFLGLSTLEEAMALRDRGIRAPLLLLGDRHESELSWCLAQDLTCCLSEAHTVTELGRLAERAGKRVPVHLKINTGMNRYGVRWHEAETVIDLIRSTKSLVLEGVLSHLAQSDELDKTFALLQLARFNEVLGRMSGRGLAVRFRHLCNSGGFLDLPQAHFDMVRLGILPLGVYPSSVCRRLPGIEPVMQVKARIAAIQYLRPGDSVGYGMRYTASDHRRVGVVPLGYGDGFPRVRNEGWVLVRGRRAPIVGGIAMDAFMVDLTDIPAAQLWDEAVLMGRQGDEEITIHDIAKLKRSVSYDALTAWRARLPRVYLNQQADR